MKKFDIPEYYRSPIISKVKAKRKLEDPRKQNFSPSFLKFDGIEFIISRHFGFCYGVENAIEKSYNAVHENPDKRIFLISQMIHNPDVNADLQSLGVQFIQDTEGNVLIPWEDIQSDDIVIIPAFGTTIETMDIIESKGLDTQMYNTTCPFVEKVWNRSAKLGENNHTVIIHGKHRHEETRATFSHSQANSPSIILKDIHEARILKDYINGKLNADYILEKFKGKYSKGFNPEIHLKKIGVVNQTTMLATETQAISDFLRQVMIEKYGKESINDHIADTRDTLCYATNDNQSATLKLLESEADLAIVVGGHNSSNTIHLVELLEKKFSSFFIRNEHDILNINEIKSFDIHKKELKIIEKYLPKKDNLKIIITSGASCPDAVIDRVIQRILHLNNVKFDPNSIEI
tara:strand:+ start:679 stop:1890 length:1212 start_codon:yes stop_codon:yes gene_type:complete